MTNQKLETNFASSEYEDRFLERDRSLSQRARQEKNRLIASFISSGRYFLESKYKGRLTDMGSEWRHFGRSWSNEEDWKRFKSYGPIIYSQGTLEHAEFVAKYGTDAQFIRYLEKQLGRDKSLYSSELTRKSLERFLSPLTARKIGDLKKIQEKTHFSSEDSILFGDYYGSFESPTPIEFMSCVNSPVAYSYGCYGKCGANWKREFTMGEMAVLSAFDLCMGNRKDNEMLKGAIDRIYLFLEFLNEQPSAIPEDHSVHCGKYGLKHIYSPRGCGYYVGHTGREIYQMNAASIEALFAVKAQRQTRELIEEKMKSINNPNNKIRLQKILERI